MTAGALLLALTLLGSNAGFLPLFWVLPPAFASLVSDRLAPRWRSALLTVSFLPALGPCRVKGSTVDVKGSTVDVKGSTVDVKGSTVDVKGSTVDVKDGGYARSRSALLLPVVWGVEFTLAVIGTGGPVQ
eukprot:1180027-Prorocentrum_minimum.AAC.4